MGMRSLISRGGSQYQPGAERSQIPTGAGVLKYGAFGLAAVTGAVLATPKIVDAVQEHTVLTSMFLTSAGVYTLVSEPKSWYVAERKVLEPGARRLVGAGMALVGVVGLGGVANNKLNNESGKAVSVDGSATPADGSLTAASAAEANTSCELLLDFDQVPQGQEWREAIDAQVLQALAYESGGYNQFGATGDLSDPAQQTQFIDGELGPQSNTAIRNYRGTLDLPLALEGQKSWDPQGVMCGAIESLNDGDYSTPSFDGLPQLTQQRVEAYQTHGYGD